MSTFLEGVQALAHECDLASAPSSVVNQTGEYGDLVRWFQQAYREIENRHNWRWLRRTASVSTVSNDDTYVYTDFTDETDAAAISRFGSWRVADEYDAPKIYLSSGGVGGQRWLTYTPWEYFKSIYRIGTQNSGAPAHISVDPANRIILGPKPNGVYVLTLDYYMGPQTLSANADIPGMPTRFHDLIVYRAMEKYGYREIAPDVLARAAKEGRMLMRQLEADQCEPMMWPGPMA